ncbi:RNA polymerase sigma factor [Streptomyces geranii]|uniref:RNA polymerase sigma factor n=1 Tax=Streptomyces geranii TaxID=2058923 RepID=UPI000D033CE4|nr:sigma-70 family RNA polymerase sigma factor [Streptomyces geranii]
MTPVPRKRARGKPIATWDDFFTEYAESLYRYAGYLSYGSDGFEGEGQMNVILARIKNDWDSIDPVTASGYARRALLNALISYKRVNRPHMVPLQQTSRSGQVYSVDLPDPAPTPEDLTASNDLLARALEVIHGLTPEHKEVLIMIYAGHTSKQIAELLEQKPGTIRQRLRRARQEFDQACDSELLRTLTQKVTKGVR